jgi:hypothetical protein
MTIMMDETIRAIWFVQVTPTQDFLQAINEPTPGNYEMQYRFRYYVSLHPFDERDVKNWYAVKSKRGTLTEFIQKCAKVAHTLGDACGAKKRGQFFELIRGQQSLDLFMETLRNQRFLHSRKEHEDDPPKL